LGSVVGIHFEVAGMYTGTLIGNLIATVERIEKKIEQRRIDEELHEIFSMQIPTNESDRILMGAA
jgi:hypothetical protein